MLARSCSIACAVLLSLALSGPSFAAKRKSDTKRSVHATESRGSANSGSAIRRPDPDPYAYGVNWPGKW